MYIVGVDDNDREKDATRHLLSHLFFRLDLLKYLGLGEASWVIMEAQKPHLVPGLRGDVDILAGNLELNNHTNAARRFEVATGFVESCCRRGEVFLFQSICGAPIREGFP